MKKPNFFLVILFFLSALISCNCSSPQEKKESIEKANNTILKIDFKYYIGKEVKMFLNDKRLPKMVKYRFVDDPPGLLSNLDIEYKNKFYVDIYINKLIYTKRIDTLRSWQLRDFEKEKIFRIDVLRDDKVIKSVY